MDEIELQLTAEQCTAVSYNLFRVSPLTALGLKLLTSCIPARFGASTISGGLYFYFLFFIFIFIFFCFFIGNHECCFASGDGMVWYGIGL